MKLLVAYASTHGTTRTIAHYVMEQAFKKGHTVVLLPLAEAADLALSWFDGAVLVASIHAGHYQKDLARFVHDEPGRLNGCATLFLSVSLAAAGHDDAAWKDLQRIADDMSAATGWTPDQIAHVAGAYTPEAYDVVTRFVMRRIVAKKDPEADLDKEITYTDWEALDATLGEWMAGLATSGLAK